jgi:hypothetical protein
VRGYKAIASRFKYAQSQWLCGADPNGQPFFQTHHDSAYRDLHTALFNRRINVESVMFRFLFLIKSLRFCSDLFV